MRTIFVLGFLLALGSLLYGITKLQSQQKEDGLWGSDQQVNSFQQASGFFVERGQRFARDLRQGINQVKQTDYRPTIRRVTKFVVSRVSHFVEDLGTALGNIRSVEQLFVSQD